MEDEAQGTVGGADVAQCVDYSAPPNTSMPPFDAHAYKVESLRDNLGLVTSKELADLLGLSTQTLSLWRSAGDGPDYVKLGKTVFYRESELKAWIDANVKHIHQEFTQAELPLEFPPTYTVTVTTD